MGLQVGVDPDRDRRDGAGMLSMTVPSGLIGQGRHAPIGTEGSLWRNQFAPRFVFALPRYAPGKLAERLGMPLLVCVADRDHETPANFAARVVERAPRGELRRYPVSHFEMYHGETLQRVLADQVGFLRAHLLSETAGRVRAG
jgi:hypothetical protein